MAQRLVSEVTRDEDRSLRIPAFDPPRRSGVRGQLCGSGAIDLRDEGCRRSGDERLDPASSSDEGVGKIRKARLADDHQ